MEKDLIEGLIKTLLGFLSKNKNANVNANTLAKLLKDPKQLESIFTDVKKDFEGQGDFTQVLKLLSVVLGTINPIYGLIASAVESMIEAVLNNKDLSTAAQAWVTENGNKVPNFPAVA
jgi:hypothetical protein